MALNFKVIADDVVKNATLTATPPFIPTLDVNYLKNVLRGEVAKTTSTATHTIRINFAKRALIDSFALSRHNLTSPFTTLQLKLYAEQNQTGGVVYDSGEFKAVKTLGWGEFVWGKDVWGGSVFRGEDANKAFTQHYFNAVYAYSAELIIQDTNPIFPYFQMCRLYLGTSIAVNSKAIMPLDLTENQNKEFMRMESGISYPISVGQDFRAFAINLNVMPQGEAFILYRALKEIKAQDVWVSLFPENESSTKEQLFSFSARIESLPKITASANSYWYDSNIVFVET